MKKRYIISIIILFGAILYIGEVRAITYNSLFNAFSFSNVLQLEGDRVEIGSVSIPTSGFFIQRNIVLIAEGVLTLLDDSVSIDKTGITLSDINVQGSANSNLSIQNNAGILGVSGNFVSGDFLHTPQVAVGENENFKPNTLSVSRVESDEITGFLGSPLVLGDANDEIILNSENTDVGFISAGENDLCVYKSIAFSYNTSGELIIEGPTSCGDGYYFFDINVDERKILCCRACAIDEKNVDSQTPKCANQVINSIPTQSQ